MLYQDCKILIVIAFMCVGALSAEIDYYQPEQIHIAFGDKANDIIVTWSTRNATESLAEYGPGGLGLRARGRSTLFVDGGPQRRAQHIHRVLLRDLDYETEYLYIVGSVRGWSERLSFRSPGGARGPVRAALYGDMGNVNAQNPCSRSGEDVKNIFDPYEPKIHALSYLQEEVARRHFDVVLHVGDFAYDMDSDDAQVGDQFMRQIQPIASALPYMVCPGNHEQAYNFSNYKSRFSMPGGAESMFYSWDLGPVHFVSLSTEFYYYTNYGLKQISEQYHWLIKDLENANKEENRARRPWIVVYGHRPMYCSNSNDPDCGYELTRFGLTVFGFYALEPILNSYSVDVAVWAHEHSYERTWPVAGGRVANGSSLRPYSDAGAPVHVVTGSAGCREGRDRFKVKVNSWSAFHSQDYGYTRMTAYNNTHLYFEQVSVDLDGQVIDSFWIDKTRLRYS